MDSLDYETCSICGVKIPLRQDSIWSDPNSQKSFSVEMPIIHVACVRISEGELDICENCYDDLPDRFDDQDLFEIHYQFGLEFKNSDLHSKAIGCFRLALEFQKTPSVLTALAYSLTRVGDISTAKELYEEALSVDPNNLIASNNLKKLTS